MFLFHFTPFLVIFLASQFYWALRARAWGIRHIRTRARRIGAAITVIGAYGFLFAFNFWWLDERPTPTRMTAYEALLASPFLWWVFSSMVAFLVAALLGVVKVVALAAGWTVRQLFARRREVSPSRRIFLERTAAAAIAAPFVAGAYGLLYGRLNLQTTERRIRLARLPKAFRGFRIAQLSDIHVGPFMSEAEIRNYVRIANSLKPDLTVLTGDFITWDPSTQQAVVSALAGLKAPFGIFGCLGNHEAWSGTEDSIALLFAQAGIRMLRQARVAITTGGEAINLIGVDFQTGWHGAYRDRHYVARVLPGVENLIVPETANILLSHNPNTFDRAAELGIDLSLAGHTHGGQVALEFVNPQIAPSRLVTPYVSGWFQKPGGQLYVNRGIGTIAAPMRIGAPPEISVFVLAGREAMNESADKRG